VSHTEQIAEQRQFRVVVVDDDRIQMAPFFVELNLRGIDTISMDDADQCLEYMETGGNASLFVIDIMLESPVRYSQALTNNYLLTGLSVARDVRKFCPDAPIILFSNMVRAELVTEILKVAEKVGNCVLIQKHTICEFGQFADLVETILLKGIKDNSSKSLWKRLGDSVQLKPSFFGVGIDLKALAKNLH
jgi:CheY-like chemotaxis protein